MRISQFKLVQTASIATAIAVIGSFGQAYAQDSPPATDAVPPAQSDPAPAPIAPPVDPQPVDSNTFNWKDVPANQQIAIDRAVFDQGGYQLYCHTGETIVVPFADQNLYVMKFGRSNGGGTYFVNDGSTPTLYVPEGGYLENSAADGAKWYPFPDTYNYTIPVYLGVAPTWDAYMDMAWYPDMYCCGGYWCYNSYAPGVVFVAMPGCYVSIFDQPYYGWNAYRTYYYAHPADRIFFRTAPVFGYGRFPARGPAFVVHSRAFGAGAVDRNAHFGAGANPAFHSNSGRPGAFGGAHFGDADSSRAVTPAPAAHVWGSQTPSSRPAFGIRLGTEGSPASGAGETARRPFGGLQSLPASSTRSYWGDGSSSHNWGSSGSSSSGSSHPAPSGSSSHPEPSSGKDPKTGK